MALRDEQGIAGSDRVIRDSISEEGTFELKSALPEKGQLKETGHC